ncbi:16S rRNA (guanine(527)-N(7))-methyltransferase RsmG [Sphingomonas ginkgonis]|uniref:Ribosomal RNA small subunit methyltransferase G n=1 Tax=Sphingomonas ginkgonis TaxID=2315330 RepID=A0A429V789_9SPHN|nr:16S rRNA (guanine(527)-N(7))-methyltransferase RsmG [Sphingomonas ginkgonis]RST29752.1 16S rRNA (guanine(527)-N(7))-methyltransferase RsmG [Sphingomonas ginkgonis]
MIEAFAAASGRDVSRETWKQLNEYVRLLVDENKRQNLIAKSSVAEVWSRHLLDSAQLVRLSSPLIRTWLDIGSGAGLPGVVTAILTNEPTTLVEPRPLRTAFLTKVKHDLGLDNLEIVTGKVEGVSGPYSTITARAVASLSNLFAAAWQLAAPETLWILPKGRGAKIEVEEARQAWQGDFRFEPSLTSTESLIVVASGVRPRFRGGKR